MPDDVIDAFKNRDLVARPLDNKFAIRFYDRYDDKTENVPIYHKEDARKLAEALLAWADS